MKKLVLLSLLTVGFSQAIELKVDPLGAFNVGGALTIYGMQTSNRVGLDKRTRYDVGSAILNISKPAQPFGFNILGGSYSMPVVGVGISKATEYTDLFSPIPIAYFELSPVKGLSLQVGKLPTIIGYESAFTYQNNYIQRGLVWNMQPVVNNGVRLSYSGDLFFFKLGINDGFYTLSTSDPKPALEGSVGITPIKDSSVGINFLIPDKSAKPNPTSAPANKRELNLLASYTFDKLSLGVDAVYVEAPKDLKAGVLEKAKASGLAFHVSYDLKPIKLSGRIESVKDNSDAGSVDLVGLGDNNRAWTITLTPSYSKGPFLIRGDISWVSAKHPFTNNGKKSQTRVGLELGLLF